MIVQKHTLKQTLKKKMAAIMTNEQQTGDNYSHSTKEPVWLQLLEKVCQHFMKQAAAVAIPAADKCPL